MDREFEPDDLDMFLDWSEDDFQPTFFQTDPPFTALEDANSMEHFNSQTELPPLAPTALHTVVETMEPTSWSYEGSSSAAALTFVPNPLPPLPSTQLLHPTQLSPPLSSAEGLMLDGVVPPVQSQDVSLSSYFNQLSNLQNENSVTHQAIHLYDAQSPINQLSIQQRTQNSNINQSSSYPALVYPNPVQAMRESESGFSSGQLAPPQRPAIFPLHNHTSNSNAAWNSRPGHTYSSVPDVYGGQYAPTFTQSSQLYNPVQNQVGQASELQQIVDLRSQNSMRPVYPRSEQYTNLHSALTKMPTNPFQQGYRPVLPNPAAPSGSSLANYGQNPSLQATRGRSFGSGSSVTPRYGSFYENQDRGQHHYPQLKMPNGHGQQSSASVQQWSQGVPSQIGEYNQRMDNTPNLQRQINTTSSQTLVSRILGHSSTRITEGTSSRVPNSREAEIASVLSLSRVRQETTVSTNEVQTSRDKGKHPATSSTGNQPSEAIRRILNMNPTGTVTWNTEQSQSNGMPIERIPYVPPRRGRPPKRRDLEGLPAQPRKSQKVSTETGNGGTTSQQGAPTLESVVNRDQNAILPNPLSATRHSVATAHDMEFQRQGRPFSPNYSNHRQGTNGPTPLK